MDSKKWNEKIKNNFNEAAYRYLEHSNIQKFFAKKIVQFIKELNPKKKGEWIDLGSGPGLLADEIEKISSQKVSRIDFSKKMLLENKLSRKKILWDLNNDLILDNESNNNFLDSLNKTLERKPILIKLAQQGHCLNNLNLYEILRNTLKD